MSEKAIKYPTRVVRRKDGTLAWQERRSSSLPASAGSATSIETASVFKGETWLAYRPGEDVKFKDAWVSRTQRGVLCSVVNSKKNLIANAKLCQVRLKWQNDRTDAQRKEP